MHPGICLAYTGMRFNAVLASTHKDRMQQNFDLFDFTLTAEDMAALRFLDCAKNAI